VGSVAKANNVSVFLNIALDASTSTDYATQYSQLSLNTPYLVELGIDDFVDQYKALFSVPTAQPAALLSMVIANVRSANRKMKFGATIYEDQLDNAYLQDAKLPASLRGQFDYVHLFIHYRTNGPNYQSYVQKAMQVFPNARIIAGSYAYDRRAFLPCTPGGSACTAQQDFDLFLQSFMVQAQLLEAGTVDGIEFYPGYFGTEDQWTSLSNPRECAPGDQVACVTNTKAMRQAALNVLMGGATAQMWTPLTPAGAAPTPRADASAAMDTVNHRMIVFGGLSNSGALNDTWILKNTNAQGGPPAWTQLATVAAPPPDYYSVGMYDPGSNRMIVFGGDSGTDVWVLTNANGLGGASSWIQLPTSGAVPAPFSGWERQVYDSANNMLIVYDSENFVWTLSNANGVGGSPVWSFLNVSNDGPSPRNSFTAVYNPSSSSMIVFGGSDGTTDYNDVWVLSNANGLAGDPNWTNVLPQGSAGAPAERSGHTAVYDAPQDIMTIFGGFGQPADTWTLVNASAVAGMPAWTMLNSGNGGPDPRTDCIAVLDTSTSSMLIFGGINTDFLNEVWALAGTP
jgi:hypothetical protein